MPFIIEMTEHGLRGGMTQCSFKKVEANNTYMNDQGIEARAWRPGHGGQGIEARACQW